MQTKIRLGLIGNGFMMRREHLPYLEKRIKEKNDIEISWASGCLCSDKEKNECPMKARGYVECENGHENDWREFLIKKPVDGIIVSLPNALHDAPIQEALSRDVNVAVDKPTTIGSKACFNLVDLADSQKLVFATLSQRRYEDIYQTVADIIRNGGLGEPRLINYLIAHEFFDRGKNTWRTQKDLAGGGALMESGYHGIDIVLWLLSQYDKPVSLKSVSAVCFTDFDPPDPNNAIETITVVLIRLDNDAIFNFVASYENPKGSLDENIKLFGSNGTIRIMRDRPRKTRSEQSAANLSYQHIRGSYNVYDTREWVGQRWAPLEDFLNAVLARKEGKEWKILSPASDSLQTIRVIEKAYESAKLNGQEIQL